ncbi:hypothetical protein D3C75_1206150 [compost metagenome]
MREVGDGRNADVWRPLLTQGLARRRNKARVNADGRGMPGRAVRLTTQRDHFLVGVIFVQRG